MNIEQEIIDLKERNKKVEENKAWETSFSRKICIIFCTYTSITLFFIVLEFPSPFINAIVPTLGFFLSTLSLRIVKKIWIKYFYNK